MKTVGLGSVNKYGRLIVHSTKIHTKSISGRPLVLEELSSWVKKIDFLSSFEAER